MYNGIPPSFKTNKDDNKVFMKIPVVGNYKYLGVIIDKNLSFKKHLEQVREKFKEIKNRMKILNWKSAPLLVISHCIKVS